MTKRITSRVLVGGAIATVLGEIIWAVATAQWQEPVYQGKTLRAWLEVVSVPSSTHWLEPNKDSAAYAEARAAIHAMGTNAIPALVRVLRAHDAPWVQRLVALAQKQSFVPIHYAAPSSRYPNSIHGLKMLGPRAAGAVPELVSIYDQNPSQKLQQGIPLVFAHIGPGAKAEIPSLLQKIQDPQTDQRVRPFAIIALGGIRSEPELVVPVLTQMLQSPSSDVRLQAICALRAFGATAKSAVPALLTLYEDPFHNVNVSGALFTREEVRLALSKIDPEALSRVSSK